MSPINTPNHKMQKRMISVALTAIAFETFIV